MSWPATADEEALEQYRESLNFSTRSPNLQLANLLHLAYVHLMRSEFGAALEYLDRARTVAPQSPAVARLSGWAYYALDRLPEATAEWKRAQKIQPSEEIAAALEKVERDRDTESEFREGQTSHFNVHYQGSATPQLAADILRTLEEHFRSLQSQLRFTPPESIAVVLYTQETFRDITRAPGWATALNDGRIRVPVQGLSTVTDELSHVLMHELTHSFVRQKTRGRCPQWLNEGLAQWMEGRRSDVSAQPLLAVYDRQNYIPLHRLEGQWSGLNWNDRGLCVRVVSGGHRIDYCHLRDVRPGSFSSNILATIRPWSPRCESPYISPTRTWSVIPRIICGAPTRNS